MQQQPQGRRPDVPQRPPQAPPPGYSPPGYSPPGYPQQAAPPPVQARPVAAKKRGSLRFLAATCIFTAWATLVISIVTALVSFGAGAAASRRSAMAGAATTRFFPQLPTTSPGGLGGGGLSGGSGEEGGLGVDLPGIGGGGGAAGIGPGAFMQMMQPYVGPLMYASGVLALVTGVVTFLLFLGLGQACYALLDLEEQSARMAQALDAIVARLGVGR
jgi:hypothetical protein